MPNHRDPSDAFRPTMDAREAKSLMRDAVGLNNVAKQTNRARAKAGIPPAELHPDFVDAMNTLKANGYSFDPDQYDHPSDVDDIAL